MFVNSRKDSPQISKNNQSTHHESHSQDYHSLSVSRQSFYQRNLDKDQHRKVYIILKGWIVAKDHEEGILLPKIIAK